MLQSNKSNEIQTKEVVFTLKRAKKQLSAYDEDSGEGDTIKITVDFDTQWKDTVDIDVTGGEGRD